VLVAGATRAQDPQDLPVEKLLEHFSKNDSASALAQRRVLNDLGVASQTPSAASVRAAGPLSGRRSKPPAAKPAGNGGKGPGAKVSDGDLLTSMVQRLNGLERKMAEQRNLLVEKDAEIAELRARQEERNDDARLVEELTDENIKLKRRQLEMEKFLADYGLGARKPQLSPPRALARRATRQQTEAQPALRVCRTQTAR
jgi:Mg2+ and Co2+ transporter CorA